MANNYMRLTGLATGLDTDNMVKQMMKPYNMKVDKLKAERQAMQWKQEIYRDIIKDVNKLNYDFLDVIGSEKNVTKLSGYNLYEVTDKVGSSVSINTGANVQEGRYVVNVKQVATSAKIESNQLELEDYKNFKLSGDKTLSITYKNGASKVTKDIVLTKDSSLSDIFNKIKEDTKGEVIGKYSELTKKITFETKATGKDTNIKISSPDIFTSSDGNKITFSAKVESGEFTLKDYEDFKLSEDKTLTIEYGTVKKDIVLTKDSSLSDIFNKIKEDTMGEVIGKYSELTKKITFETEAKDKDTTIKISSNIFTTSDGSNIIFNNSEYKGQEALFDISAPGGIEVKDQTSSTNNFTADGITYNLVKNGTTEFTLGKNVDKAYDKIKGFVDEYNKLIDKISGKVGEKKDYSFKPLSEEQRKELKDDEIKKWDEKAKLGLLRGDSDLQNMLNNLRKAFFENVEGTNVRFGDKLGISTSSDYLKGGKIEINESKFKQALRDDSEGVLKLFTNISDTPYSAVDKDKREKRYSENGIFQRVKDVFLDYTRTLGYGSDKKGILIEKAGIKDEYGSFNEFKNYISEQMKEKDKVIFNLEKDLGRRENKYYMQFAQLEKMMNKMNSQSSWLMSQLGTGAQ